MDHFKNLIELPKLGINIKFNRNKMNPNLIKLSDLSHKTKYLVWYLSIVSSALVRNYKRKTFDGYEYHHILPKSLGGNNTQDNLVSLTSREHFIVHLLLVRMLKFDNDKNKMIYALFNMKSYNSTYTRYYNSRFYQTYKKQWQSLQSQNRKRVLSDPVKRQEFIDRSKKNVQNPIVREKISKTLTGRKREGMNKDILSLRGENRTEAQKMASKRHSEKMKGRPSKFKGVRNKYGRKIKTPDGIFEKGIDVSKFYGITTGTVTYRCKNKLFGFEYI